MPLEDSPRYWWKDWYRLEAVIFFQNNVRLKTARIHKWVLRGSNENLSFLSSVTGDFHRSLTDSKYPLIFKIILNILENFNCASARTIFHFTLTSSSPRLFSSSLGISPKTTIMDGISNRSTYSTFLYGLSIYSFFCFYFHCIVDRSCKI